MNNRLTKKSNELILYNNILSLSRNKLFYTKFALADTFQNRINLIFFHISFIFIKFNKNKKKNDHKIFYQKLFDIAFNQIELNMRELGYGDVTVNKNMKFLVKTFYIPWMAFSKFAYSFFPFLVNMSNLTMHFSIFKFSRIFFKRRT